MTTPAIRALKETFKESRITLLCSSMSSEIAKEIPLIDEIYVYDAPWVKLDGKERKKEEMWTAVRDIEKEKFDLAVNFTVYSQNPLPAATFCFLAGIPERLGYSRENPYQLLTKWIKETEPQKNIKHGVRRNLDLVKEIGAETRNEEISIKISEDHISEISGMLANIVNKKWITIHPGGSNKKRLYPWKKYKAISRELVRRGYNIVYTGTDNEKLLIEKISSELSANNFISLAGKLDIRKLIALISLSPLFLSNDTGPVHIAAAVKTPVVVLYAMTNPQHVPWKVSSRVLYFRVLCTDCKLGICTIRHENIPLPEPIIVVNAVEDLLGKEGTGQKINDYDFNRETSVRSYQYYDTDNLWNFKNI